MKSLLVVVCVVCLSGCATFSADVDKLSDGLVAVGKGLEKIEGEYALLCGDQPVLPAKECESLKRVINDVVEGYSAVNAVVKAQQ